MHESLGKLRESFRLRSSVLLWCVVGLAVALDLTLLGMGFSGSHIKADMWSVGVAGTAIAAFFVQREPVRLEVRDRGLQIHSLVCSRSIPWPSVTKVSLGVAGTLRLGRSAASLRAVGVKVDYQVCVELAGGAPLVVHARKVDRATCQAIAERVLRGAGLWVHTRGADTLEAVRV